MKIVIVGASGTIGRAVVQALQDKHEIVNASRNGDIQVDLQKPESIQEMFRAVKSIDALVCTAGDAKFGTLQSLHDEDFEYSIRNKLMGQINLVRYGMDALNSEGVITLTTGVLAHNPGEQTAALTMVNRGLEGFVEAAELTMPDGLRLNAVCPPLIRETAEKMGWGPGGMAASQVAEYYVLSIESGSTGMLYGPEHESPA